MEAKRGFGSTIAQRGRAYGSLAQAMMQSRCCTWLGNLVGSRLSQMDAAISPPASDFPAQTKYWHCRFPHCPPGSSFLGDLKATDAVVLLTHSFEQDSRILATLFSGASCPPILAYLVRSAEPAKFLPSLPICLDIPNPAERVEQWLAQMHAPTGLDLGAETPAAIALSIIAEIQQTLNNGSAMPLRQVRAVQPVTSHS